LTFCVAFSGLFVNRQRMSVKVLGIATLVLMILSTNFWGFSLWRWIHEFVPGSGGIRAVWRVTMSIISVTVLGVSLAFNAVLDKRRWGLALLLVSACVVEHACILSTSDKHFLREHVESLARKVEPQYEAFFLAGTGLEGRSVSIDGLWVALLTGKPSITGRYGSVPRGYQINQFKKFDSDDDKGRRKLEMALNRWLNIWDISRENIQWIEYEALTKDRLRKNRMSGFSFTNKFFKNVFLTEY